MITFNEFIESFRLMNDGAGNALASLIAGSATDLAPEGTIPETADKDEE